MDSNKNSFNFIDFPPEIIVKIFSILSPNDLKNLLQISVLFPFVYETQKLKMKNLRFMGFDKEKNPRSDQIKQVARKMKDDIITVDEEGCIKIYDVQEFKIKDCIDTGIKMVLNTYARDNIYIDETQGVVVLRNSIWESQNTGYDEITIVETRPRTVVHKDLKHSVMVDLNKCVAVLDHHVVIGDSNGEIKIWERLTGECVAEFHHNLFLRSVASGEGFFISSDIHSLKCWTVQKDNGGKFTAEELMTEKTFWRKARSLDKSIITLGVNDDSFSSKTPDWVWRPVVDDHIALVRVEGDVIAMTMTGPRGDRPYRIMVMNRLGRVVRSIATGQQFYLNCNAYNSFLWGGRLVLTFHSGVMQLWDLEEGGKLCQVEGVPFREGAVRAEERKNLLLTCDKEGKIQLRGVEDGNVVVKAHVQKPMDRQDLELVELLAKYTSI